MSVAGKLMKFISVILIMLVLFFAVSDLLAIDAVHLHGCEGEDCQICCILSSLSDIFKAFLVLSLAFCVEKAIAFALRYIKKSRLLEVVSDLVSLKVKLSD